VRQRLQIRKALTAVFVSDLLLGVELAVRKGLAAFRQLYIGLGIEVLTAKNQRSLAARRLSFPRAKTMAYSPFGNTQRSLIIKARNNNNRRR